MTTSAEGPPLINMASEPASGPDPEAPFAAALATLPGIGPATLVSLLREMPPEEVWEQVRAGQIKRSLRASATDPGRPWQEVASKIKPVEAWNRCVDRGIRVTWFGHRDYPKALADDPRPAGVLFWKGSLACLELPCVAVVGTRRATRDGCRVAFELGRDLAAAGVCVVSGLALGIDGAAHAGALSAAGHDGSTPPAGVAASGVDVPYPREHSGLWQQVTEAGVILSETPPGRPAEGWRFPVRNRMIAGLVSLVVVVESHMKGGSLVTAEAAADRGVEVRAVPGPVHSDASAGTNQLLYDGAGVVRDAQDALDTIGTLVPSGSTTRGQQVFRRTATAHPPRGVSPAAQAVLRSVGWCPTSLNQVVEGTRLGVAPALRSLDELMRAGMVAAEGGFWVRVGSSPSIK